MGARLIAEPVWEIHRRKYFTPPLRQPRQEPVFLSRSHSRTFLLPATPCLQPQSTHVWQRAKTAMYKLHLHLRLRSRTWESIKCASGARESKVFCFPVVFFPSFFSCLLPLCVTLLSAYSSSTSQCALVFFFFLNRLPYCVSTATLFCGRHNYWRHTPKRHAGSSRSGLAKENQQICLGLTERALFI